jgi:hypothetical protein
MGKGVVLSRLTYIWSSKGIYFVVWNIQVIDFKKKKGEIALEPKDKHEKQMPPSPHKPPKIQDLHVLGGGVIRVVR